MAWNPFIGWSREDLETALRQAQGDFSAGKMVNRAGDSNVLVQSTINASPEARIRRILLALNKIAPDDYPIGDITPITTAKVAFGSGTPIPAPNT